TSVTENNRRKKFDFRIELIMLHFLSFICNSSVTSVTLTTSVTDVCYRWRLPKRPQGHKLLQAQAEPPTLNLDLRPLTCRLEPELPDLLAQCDGALDLQPAIHSPLTICSVHDRIRDKAISGSNEAVVHELSEYIFLRLVLRDRVYDGVRCPESFQLHPTGQTR